MPVEKYSIGDTFRELRIDRGFTQRGLALKMGVSHSTISKIENNERSPKYELLEKYAAALNVSLDYLIVITKDTKVADALRHVKKGTSVTVEMLLDKTESVPSDMSLQIPILGSVRAGETMLAEQNIEGYIMIDRNSVCADKIYYALKVKGDSMDKLFSEGNTLIVEKTDAIENNQIAVIGINGYEATVKRVTLNDNSIALIPESNNPVYSAKVYDLSKDDIHIMGRVVQAIMQF